MFLLSFVIEIEVKLRLVIYIWRVSMVFDMITIFDLEIFKYIVLLIVFGFLKKNVVEFYYLLFSMRIWDVRYLGLYNNFVYKCFNELEKLFFGG